MDDEDYKLTIVEIGSEDWNEFHHIQRTSLFQQTVTEYDPNFHDSYFPRAADRSQLLLKWRDHPVGITTIDCFEDMSAATRSVAIADNFQGAGHGRALGLLTQEFAKSKGIEKLCVNASADALGFYRQLGFKQEAWDRHEYKGVDPSAMVQMVLRNF